MKKLPSRPNRSADEMAAYPPEYMDVCCVFFAERTRSSYFLIKWFRTFYPALFAQAASGGEKCMDYVF